jgi:hypothetical protein
LRGRILATGCAAALLALSGTGAGAQERLEATYRATLAGLAIGTGTMVLDITRNRYSIAGSGRALGLMRVLGGGKGEVSAQGAINGKKLISASYAHTIRASKLQIVKMALAGGSVKQLAVEPAITADADLAPLTEGQKRGVIDPISAGIIPAAGANGVGPEACANKLPIFDGRIRFDLTLAYKRHESVRAEGYEGPAVVCSVRFEPLGGHHKDKFAIKFLRENRDMEIWFVPIRGTPFLAFYRVFVPTPLGSGVLQATRFVATTAAPRAGALDARVQ